MGCLKTRGAVLLPPAHRRKADISQHRARLAQTEDTAPLASAKLGNGVGQCRARVAAELTRRHGDEFRSAVRRAMRECDADARGPKIDPQRKRLGAKSLFYHSGTSAFAVRPTAAPPAMKGPKRNASVRFARPVPIMTTAYRAPRMKALPIAMTAA